MLKMYRAEVLGKLPIMQHFLFGDIVAFRGVTSLEEMEAAACGQGHVHAMGQELPTCCGHKIPSAIAAAASTSSFARPIPFD